MSKRLEKLQYDAGWLGDESWIDFHHRMYDAMVNHQREHTTAEGPGKWIDPVTKREFPKDQQMIRDPNRQQRRDLGAWRRTGKVSSKRR